MAWLGPDKFQFGAMLPKFFWVAVGAAVRTRPSDIGSPGNLWGGLLALVTVVPAHRYSPLQFSRFLNERCRVLHQFDRSGA